MTIGQVTGLLARARADNETSRSITDQAVVIAFGALQWPWLLRSLFGGSPADKAALLERIGLPAEALPNLGSWKADTALLTTIVDAIETLRPSNVVELGCGVTTLVAAKALQLFGDGHLTSVDQHADFAQGTGEWLKKYGLRANVRHAPLGPPPPGWPGQWYQLDEMPQVIDLLVIDGPPWAVHPFVRSAAETLFDRIPVGGCVLLDDAARPGERIVARQWHKNWPGFEFRLDTNGTKGTLIGVRRR